MKMQGVLLSAVALGVAACPAWAKDLSKSYVMGVGTNTCDHWTEARKTEASGRVYQAWMEGFLSAATITSEHDYREIHSADVTSYMDDYCTRNPQATITLAAIKMLGGLHLDHPAAASTSAATASTIHMTRVADFEARTAELP
ncbi:MULTISPECIES: hypothetical protein [Dyella]|uniref:Uncharacterized protein n=2 Tax=Dyella TaxID=231454 RepID=A0A4R0YDG5_9GAMM|nr:MULTISPECIES: hypothetical protein [Dyella]TBR36288.1 hypothetical protein EYV96_17035 [Dyella terrae]TCI05945.1 hypothetical protein EZM97_36125 [Dyella soli]